MRNAEFSDGFRRDAAHQIVARVSGCGSFATIGCQHAFRIFMGEAIDASS